MLLQGYGWCTTRLASSAQAHGAPSCGSACSGAACGGDGCGPQHAGVVFPQAGSHHGVAHDGGCAAFCAAKDAGASGWHQPLVHSCRPGGCVPEGRAAVQVHRWHVRAPGASACHSSSMHSAELPHDDGTCTADVWLCDCSIHYFRIHPAYWEDRLMRMKALGLTAVQVTCAVAPL